MLRGASAAARDELISRVGTTGTLDESVVLGEQLLAIAGVLRVEAALRRFCTDASVDGEAKAGLASSVFSGKVEDKALDIARTAVQQRWTSSRDLADVLEELGIQALVRSSGAEYSRVSDELFAVAQLIETNSELRGALADPTRTDEDKCALLDSMLENKLLPATLRLVHQAEHGELPMGRALEEIEQIAAGVQDEVLAVVHTAKPLGRTEIDRLTQTLSKAYDATVHLHIVEDPSLIGGLRVEIGDDVIDGTVVNRLDEARRRLAR